MSTPVLHLLAGPNGAGKTTFVERVLLPEIHTPFVNADIIAAREWPEETDTYAYEAARRADAERQAFLANRRSFISETVFSHPSKISLVEQAESLGYLVHLHVILIPEELAVRRVAERVKRGGHTVPEQKIRERHRRLWRFIAAARIRAERTHLYDNSRARSPFRPVAVYHRGTLAGGAGWPAWTPPELIES